MITLADLTRLRSLHAAVTTERLGVLVDSAGAWIVAGEHRRVVVLFSTRDEKHTEHAKFFVTAQRAVPLLIADVEELRNENEQLRAELARVKEEAA